MIFWAGVGWIGYVYLGYPILLALIALVARVRPVPRDEYEPHVSVLIAARNEERDIRWKIDETLGWDYSPHKLDVLVASDASEDRTDDILASIDDPRLHWIRMEPRGGKVTALNQLAKIARGEILFFTDANAHIPANCLRRMMRQFGDPRVGCVTGDSTAVGDQGNIGSGAGAYWGYEKLIKRMENRMGSVLVCDGAIFAIRRELYTPCRPELANDLEIPFKIARRGYWVVHEPQAQVFEPDTTSVTEEFQRRRRMSAQGARGMWLLWDTLRGVRFWEFISHKLLRWLTLLPMLMILVASVRLHEEPFYAAALAAQLLFYGAAAIGLVYTLFDKPASRAFSVPFYVLLGTAGALVGVLEALAGRKFAVWEISVLSRGVEKAP
jgi:cellulose synthase/poly-beta-1,6-N-acetylglucosamine synthase-like glycosyltransferase